MSTGPTVVVHRDAQLLAEAGAARLVTRLVDVQSSRGSASVVLTGGTMGSAILGAVASSPARDAIDWSRLDVWWGDERFLPAGHPDRNETQNRAALLDAVPLDPARVHAMPGPDGPDGDDVDAAAASYEEALAGAASGGEATPIFDILMLGVGPDAHVASLFPESPALYERERSVVAVRNSPKPPPTRISLTMPALRRAEDVWFLVAGADKAQAVGLALSGAGEVQAPAAGPRGRRATIWLVDRAAARSVPPALIRLSSP
jgi:6-phosphogluconolactonase